MDFYVLNKEDNVDATVACNCRSYERRPVQRGLGELHIMSLLVDP
jgi:hypothetical protein